MAHANTAPSLQRLAALPGVDVPQGLRALLGNAVKYCKLLRRFTQFQGDQLDALRNALKARDQDTARHLAHRIKGAAATLGLVQIAAGAAHIEHQLRDADIAPARFEPELQAMQQAAIEIAATLPSEPEPESLPSKT